MIPVKRIVLAALSTLSALVLLFGYHTSTAGPLATSPPTSVYSGSVAAPSTGDTTSGGANPPQDRSGGSTGSSSGSATGRETVTGSTAQTRWGPVQVALTVDGSDITGVQVLQYPTADPQDAQINGYALPILVQETLDAQGADIDMVSGATYTSVGYQQSLQSALDQAGL